MAAGDIVVIGEAHGDIVFVFPDVVAVLVFIEGPAGHLGAFPEDAPKVFGVVVVVKEPLAGDQPPQAVVAHLRPGTHVPGDADAGVKLHNGARHNAVEGLDIGNLPEHPGVVQRFIEVGAAVFQAPGNVHILPAVELVGNQVVVGVFTLGLAQG